MDRVVAEPAVDDVVAAGLVGEAEQARSVRICVLGVDALVELVAGRAMSSLADRRDAVERLAIVPVAADEDQAVVAEDAVVAGAAGDPVVAEAADDQVVAGMAEDDVVAAHSEDHVIAGFAVDQVARADIASKAEMGRAPQQQAPAPSVRSRADRRRAP
jgi:hypothetical protein